MTHAELESAGWQRTRPQPNPLYVTMQRGDCEIVACWAARGRIMAQLRTPDFQTINGAKQWTKRGDATERALASLGACTMPDGRTVREWALSPQDAT